MAKGKRPDKLLVQVALRYNLPPGVKVSKRLNRQVLQRVIDGEPLPKNVEVRGIFWRNPNRRGSLGYWRYHRGADLSAAPSGPIESFPRGDLQDAIDTLAPFLQTGSVTF